MGDATEKIVVVILILLICTVGFLFFEGINDTNKISTNISLQNCQLAKYIDEPHGKSHDYFILLTKDGQEYKLLVSSKEYNDVKEIYDSAKILGHTDELKIDVIANLFTNEVCAMALTKNKK